MKLRTIFSFIGIVITDYLSKFRKDVRIGDEIVLDVDGNISIIRPSEDRTIKILLKPTRAIPSGSIYYFCDNSAIVSSYANAVAIGMRNCEAKEVYVKKNKKIIIFRLIRKKSKLSN